MPSRDAHILSRVNDPSLVVMDYSRLTTNLVCIESALAEWKFDSSQREYFLNKDLSILNLIGGNSTVYKLEKNDFC